MASRIPQSFIDELLARTDIVEVVNPRVRLKKTGKNYSACCPFHSEKTPSFTLSPHKQFYYCFGCGASGNAIGFVMAHDQLNFPEAVKLLAESAGLELPENTQDSALHKQEDESRLRCYQVLEQTTDFYRRQLREHPFGQTAIAYLKRRGLSGQIAKTYALGVSPPEWDALIKRFQEPSAARLTTAGPTTTELTAEMRQSLVDSGLIIEKSASQAYDRFRGRIQFPIRDVRGRVVGFGARSLGEDTPKYLNSPETRVFNKSQELYGLYECRMSRLPLQRILVTEGYMDVVALAQHGIHYSVATLGTATSEEHLRKLFKFVPEIIFCFDGDAAGRRAAQKAAEVALPFMEDGRQLKLLFLPEQEDPDSLIRQEGKQAFEKRIDQQSLALGDYLFRMHQDSINEHSLEGKARLSHLLLPLLARLPKGVFRQLMLERLAQRVGVSTESIMVSAANTPKPPNAEHQSKQAYSQQAHKQQASKQPQTHAKAPSNTPSCTIPKDLSEIDSPNKQHPLAGVGLAPMKTGVAPMEMEVAPMEMRVSPMEAFESLWSEPRSMALLMTNLLLKPQLVLTLDPDELLRLRDYAPELRMLSELYQGVQEIKLSNSDAVIGYFLAIRPEYDGLLKRWLQVIRSQNAEGLFIRDKTDAILTQEIQDVLNRYRRLELLHQYEALKDKVRLGEALTKAQRQRFQALPRQIKAIGCCE